LPWREGNDAEILEAPFLEGEGMGFLLLRMTIRGSDGDKKFERLNSG